MFEHEAIEHIFEVLKPSIKRAFERAEQRGGILDTLTYSWLVGLLSKLENEGVGEFEVVIKPDFKTVVAKIYPKVFFISERGKDVFSELIMRASALSVAPRIDDKIDLRMTFKDMFLEEDNNDEK